MTQYLTYIRLSLSDSITSDLTECRVRIYQETDLVRHGVGYTGFVWTHLCAPWRTLPYPNPCYTTPYVLIAWQNSDAS